MFDREPEITVGIINAETILLRTSEPFFAEDPTMCLSGEMVLFLTEDEQIAIRLKGDDAETYMTVPEGSVFYPLDPNGWFEVDGVIIGIGFHWEREENQRFNGGLTWVRENGWLTLVNVIGIERYLESVISSEMSARSPLESLKSHALISRSWLTAQLVSRNTRMEGDDRSNRTIREESDQIIRWHDREDHRLYDICADDHCQRYQGITRIISETVRQAVTATRGQVLIFGDTICDARYSKCCGGITESFEHVWEPIPYPYLTAVRDAGSPDSPLADLREEKSFEHWVRQAPEAFCHTHDREKLSVILNGYDQETPDFYRWTVTYDQPELSDLIRERTGIDFGTVTDLIPIERGHSGRLVRLKVIGTKNTRIIGKELYIRKALSASHLYSSAFTIEKERINGNVRFILRGAGWGHGVGLCQIGSGMMAFGGYGYRDILAHYYPGSDILKIW